MLKSALIHPEILSALGRNGHGAKILITDGNFPVTTNTPAFSSKVFLNLAPDMCKVTDVLRILLSSIPVEKAIGMIPGKNVYESIHNEFSEILGNEIELIKLSKADFYEHAESKENCLTIVTGETRRFANIILVMGVKVFDRLIE